MGFKVVDQPDHIAKVLAELQAHKESLQNRLVSLDNAIKGLHGLQSSASASSEFEALNDAEETLADRGEAEGDASVQAEPLREQTADVLPPLAVRTPEVDASQRRELILRYDASNSPADTFKALNRPAQGPAVDRGKANHLNVYVNRNTEWASHQFVAPHSSRAVFRHKTGHRCPKCGSQDTRLSLTRGISDCFMFLFDYSRARCRNCDTRFRIWRSRDEHDDQSEADVHSPENT
jgi:hypothetical protein